MVELPTGRVTLLFIDVEGSTRLVQQLGAGYGGVLDDCRRLWRRAVGEAGGYEVDCRADELFAVFRHAAEALAAAVAAQQTLGGHAWPEGVRLRVRMGLHTGEPELESGSYLGLDVNRAARICAAGHGGQILLSQTSRDALVGTAAFRDLGAYGLSGLLQPERIYQLLVPGLRSDFPPLRVARQGRLGMISQRLQLRPRQLTLEQTARLVRTQIPRAPAALRQRLSALAAQFFVADRVAARADALLARVDQERLSRRLEAQREMAVHSEPAERERESLERKLACVLRLRECRLALSELAAELPSVLEQLQTEPAIDAVRERVGTATAELDDCVGEAARNLDPLSFKLARTRHRGVYSSGGHWIVPFTDELGVDRFREFETQAEAREFRIALELVEQEKGRHDAGHWSKYISGGGSAT